MLNRGYLPTSSHVATRSMTWWTKNPFDGAHWVQHAAPNGGSTVQNQNTSETKKFSIYVDVEYMFSIPRTSCFHIFCLGRNPAFAGCFARGLFFRLKGFWPRSFMISYVVIFSATQSTVSRLLVWSTTKNSVLVILWVVSGTGIPAMHTASGCRFQPHFTKLTPSNCNTCLCCQRVLKLLRFKIPPSGCFFAWTLVQARIQPKAEIMAWMKIHMIHDKGTPNHPF